METIGDEKSIYIELFFLNSKMNKTHKRAGSYWYPNFIKALMDGHIKPYTNEKPLPTRIKARGFYIHTNKDNRASTIFVRTKNKFYMIYDGYEGWAVRGKDGSLTNKVIEGECYINRSSYGINITYMTNDNTRRQRWGAQLYRNGRGIKEISEMEMMQKITELSI